MRRRLADFVAAHNFRRWLNPLKGLTPQRVHRQAVGFTAPTVHLQPAAENSATKHLYGGIGLLEPPTIANDEAASTLDVVVQSEILQVHRLQLPRR